MSHTTHSKEIQHKIVSHLFHNGVKTEETIIQELNLTVDEFGENSEYLLEIRFIGCQHNKDSKVTEDTRYTITGVGTRYLYPDLFIS